MYGPRPIRFPAHWCADYSKYRGFLAGGISTASSLLPFLEHGSAAKTLISHPHNTASYAGYRSISPVQLFSAEHWGLERTLVAFYLERFSIFLAEMC